MHNTKVRNIVCYLINQVGSRDEVYALLEDLVGETSDEKIKLWMWKAKAAQYESNTDYIYIFNLSVKTVLSELYGEEYLYWEDVCSRVVGLIDIGEIGTERYKFCTAEYAKLMVEFLPEHDGYYTVSHILAREDMYYSILSDIYKLIGSKSTSRRFSDIAKTHKSVDHSIRVLDIYVELADLLEAIKHNHMEAGMDIYNNWSRFCNLVYYMYVFIREVKQDNTIEYSTKIDEAALKDLVSSNTVSTFASVFVPTLKVKDRGSDKNIYEEESAVSVIEDAVNYIKSVINNATYENVVRLTECILPLGAYLENDSSRKKFVRFVREAVKCTADSNHSKYANSALQVVKAYCSEHSGDNYHLKRLID